MADLVDDAAGQLQQASTHLTRAGVRTSVTLAGKATRISATTASGASGVVVRALVALLDAARAAAGIRRGDGRVSLRRFTQLAEGKREFVPIKDAEVARQLSRELRRHGVTFAVERGADKTLTFHVQGKDAGLIEHALTQASIRVDERIRRAHERGGKRNEAHSESVEQEIEPEVVSLDAEQKSGLGDAIRASRADKDSELADVIERDGAVALTAENLDAIDAAIAAQPELQDSLADVVAAMEDERSAITVSEAAEAARAEVASLQQQVRTAERDAREARYAADFGGEGPEREAELARAVRADEVAEAARVELRDRHGIELPDPEVTALMQQVETAERDAREARYAADFGGEGPEREVELARAVRADEVAEAARVELRDRHGIDLSAAAGDHAATRAAVQAELGRQYTDAAGARLETADRAASPATTNDQLSERAEDAGRKEVAPSKQPKPAAEAKSSREAAQEALVARYGAGFDTPRAAESFATSVVDLYEHSDDFLVAVAARGGLPVTAFSDAWSNPDLTPANVNSLLQQVYGTADRGALERAQPAIKYSHLSQRDATRERVASKIDAKVGDLKAGLAVGQQESKLLQRGAAHSLHQGR
ncbi:hypothetical protein NS220_14260 [Microbacterium testaceum]|uniref:Uncharacterized protein n=1 Tax=Microbacterium testaceum TaxID=2033 RepID=A0A147EV22_MICTE|nr:DUF3801 domain-containing protein [Microbacterium testaceum]KTR92599.1 hypothetical protein NS220_14260 [Microbacterium testaceum]